MRQSLFEIASNDLIALNTWKMVLDGDTGAVEGAGQFVELALGGLFLRRPISVCSVDEGRLTLVYKVVGEGTGMMSRMLPGEKLDILTGLGHGFDTAACSGSALLIGGGVGTAPLYQLAKELIAAGRKVTVVLGFNKADEAMLVDDFAALGADVHIATMDGSMGTRGFVTDVIKDGGLTFDYMYACGPKPMLKAVCEQVGGNGEVSMEERMGCGFGICYGCTIQTSGGPRRVCKDGPVFKKEEIVW